jgi:hypothetical protein
MATTDGILDSILASIPAGTPPPGVKSDFYGHPATMGTPFIIVGAILVPIMLAFVALRMYTKFRIMHNAWWDDCKSSLDVLLRVAKIADNHL